MNAMTVPAPAKINLFLHVTGRRDDGYHTLESLFVALDLCDRIRLSTRSDGAIVRTRGLAGVAPEDDLAVRAAVAMKREAVHVRGGDRADALGVELEIDKRIPAGAGLGGGSSDAASVLLALNRLWNLRLPRATLMRIATPLGADVPFFVGGASSFARGIGDRLTPVSLPPLWVALIVPPINVPTAAIFSARELTRNTPSAKMDVFSEGYGRNDLQPVATARYPDVAAALASLQRYSNRARMTGSGGGVFAAFHSEPEARIAVEARPARMHGFVARTLSRHPIGAFA